MMGDREQSGGDRAARQDIHSPHYHQLSSKYKS
jgi:hypothetical protein